MEENGTRKILHQRGKKEYVIDLSHTIENGLITYKGLPAPRFASSHYLRLFK